MMSIFRFPSLIFQYGIQFSESCVEHAFCTLGVNDSLGAGVDLVTAGKCMGYDDLFVLHGHFSIPLNVLYGEHFLDPLVLAFVVGEHGDEWP